MFEKKLGEGALTANVSQHHEFEADLHEFGAHAKRVVEGKEAYKAEDFTSRINKFAPSLIRHLNDEIATLDWRILKEKLTEEDCKALMESAIAHAQAHFTFDALVMAYCNINRGRTPWFPLLPKPFELFIQYVWWWKSRASWKFGASDVFGRLKPEYEQYENDAKA